MTKKRLQEINLKLEFELPDDGLQLDMFEETPDINTRIVKLLHAADCENEPTCAGDCAGCK